MAAWIWGIALLFTIFCLLLYIKVQVTVHVREDESFQGVNLQIHSLFYKYSRQYDYTDPRLRLIESILISSKIKIPPRHAATILPENKKYLSFFRNHPIKYIVLSAAEDGEVLSFGLKYLLVTDLEWKTVVGSQDAFRTALDTGICWSVKGIIIGFLSSKCKLGRLFLNVKPDFANPAFYSTITCILKMRTVHIIFIEIFIIAKKVRWWIDGIRTGSGARAVQTSN
jgi:Protein of unknown function (DUF2953).